MANFNLVVNTSNFKPFTYEEMARPLLLYKKEEEDRQQAYLDLLEKASTLEDLASSELDAESYNTYQLYKNKIQDVVDSMVKNGLTRKNAQVFQLRNEYMNNIKPLNDLIAKRGKLIEEQRQLDKDGTNIYSIDYGNMSLADMQKMPTLTYNVVNGNAVMGISAQTFAPLAKLILESPEYSNILGNQYFLERLLRGYTLNDLIKELQNTEIGNKLYDLKLNILNSLGLKDRGFSTDKQKQVEHWVNMGAMQALGLTEYNNLHNQAFIDPVKQQALDLNDMEFNFKYDVKNGKIQGYLQDYLQGYNQMHSKNNLQAAKPKKSINVFFELGNKADMTDIRIGARIKYKDIPQGVYKDQFEALGDNATYYQLVNENNKVVGYQVLYPDTVAATSQPQNQQNTIIPAQEMDAANIGESE